MFLHPFRLISNVTLTLVLIFAVAPLPPATAQAITRSAAPPVTMPPGDTNWAPVFAAPGVGNSSSASACTYPYFCGPPTVNATVVDATGNLYVGGGFTVAGGAPARNVARWDGVRWAPLGAGLPFTVNGLAVASDGSLYAAGAGDLASGLASVMRWDGSTWQSVGSVNGYVHALGADAAGHVYVAGLFQKVNDLVVNNIARYDPSSGWVALGPGSVGTNGEVAALWVTPAGNLYAAGSFRKAGDVWSGPVAYWDRSKWNVLGLIGVPQDYAGSLALDSAGNLYASVACVVFCGAVIKFDGQTWSALPNSSTLGYLTASNGQVYAAGPPPGTPGNTVTIQRWGGGSWSPVGAALAGSISTISFDAAGTLYAGGYLGSAGDTVVSGIAAWDGTAWHGLGPGGAGGALGPIDALAVDTRGGSPAVYVSGPFGSVAALPGIGGIVAANNIARYDASGWHALGSGLANCDGEPGCALEAHALALIGSDLYAGGNFRTAGGQTVNFIARWDGSRWWPLGGGVDGPVNALATDPSGNLYAGGAFTHADGLPVEGVARWDGVGWGRLPAEAYPSEGTVSALTYDAQSGRLYLGGVFYANGWRQLLEWDGFRYYAITGNTISFISSLAVVHNGGTTLLFAGSGTKQGQTAPYLQVYDGYQWAAPDAGMNGPVYALAVSGGANPVVYAGGQFTYAGNTAAARIASWDGFKWSVLGSGTSDQVDALAFGADGRLYAGGWFDMAGPQYGSNLAAWVPAGLSPALKLNYTRGAPGSYFTAGATGFSAGGQAIVVVNGQILATGLPIDGAGGVSFTLNTAGASPGRYVVMVSGSPAMDPLAPAGPGPVASAAFDLDPAAPMRPQQGSADQIVVPPGIGLDHTVFTPLARR